MSNPGKYFLAWTPVPLGIIFYQSFLNVNSVGLLYPCGSMCCLTL